MKLTALAAHFRASSAFVALAADVRARHVTRLPVLRAARPFLLACLAQVWGAPVLYVTVRGKDAYNVSEQLPVWLEDGVRVLRYAEPTPAFYDRLAWDKTVIRERLEALSALHSTDALPVLVASLRALMQRTLTPQAFAAHTLTLEIGVRHTPQTLVKTLLGMGYEPVTMVLESGTFSRRGGIVDVYPIDAPQPLRVEFFGDVVDTIRAFDPSTQRSQARLTQARFTPARELLPTQYAQIAAALAALPQEERVLGLAQDLEAFVEGAPHPFAEHYAPFLADAPASLLDHVPSDALIVLDDCEELAARHDVLAEQAQSNRANNLATQQLSSAHPLPYVTWEALAAQLQARTTLELTHSSEESTARLFAPLPHFSGEVRTVVRHLRAQQEAGTAAIVVSNQVDRLLSAWREQDVEGFFPKLDALTGELPPLAFLAGELSGGWELRGTLPPVQLITDAEIFNWSRPEPRRRKAEKRAVRQTPESDYADWREGEYVVHVDFGVGQFRGLATREDASGRREYLVIGYEGTDTVLVPIHQADRLTRYVGANESAPKLNSLSRPTEWQRAKDRARKAAEDEARELLEIYAKRASVQGYAFRPDSVYQQELEASFPYLETPDQLNALREIKADMERSVPMDRLVCGDVGYGKTEVALRAAFKAVMDGKQVAVLVPTTVLAEQHYQTFSRRMEPFGVEIALLSRFKTEQQQDSTVRRALLGKVDILIGTHRLLSDDVTLPNLGLIIIDEEQRFGVKQKEHFKRLRAEVDILTLTATPIPRTLYLSLSGIRDISMIQTPPEERLPVITHVSAFNEKLARQAILREIDRGGQVFIIHNRVKTLPTLRQQFEALVPEARFVIAHGQMSSRQLEGVIGDFTRGEYDVLMATSIIENGIDMPNVNTLIVDRSELFGLSQLYQIRGRVGRGAQQAYAYFFYNKKHMTEEARQRLETLAQYTDLGVGLQIALRDLELRGAGDILSTRQSGHVTNVGLQLYSQMLQRAVQRLKHDDKQLPTPVPQDEGERIVIDLPLAAYIPQSWIPEMSLRLQLYRRIGSVRDEAALDALAEELRDRFGQLPRAVEQLLYQMRVKLAAQRVRATSVAMPRDRVVIKLGWLSAVNRLLLERMLGEDVEVSRVAVAFRAKPETWHARLLEILAQLVTGMPKEQGV